ncbi:MAG: DUF58 domain-containing protein [Thermoplasmatota archaeon]
MALFLIALLAGTFAPAALALVLLLYLDHTRRSARARFRETTVRVTRRVLDPIVHEGTPFHVELDASASEVAPGVALRVEDLLPEGVEAREAPILDGPTRGQYAAIASSRSTLRYHAAQTTLTDARGFWIAEREIPALTDVSVLASTSVLSAGRLLARRSPLDATTKSPVGQIVRDLEFEGLRAYQGGDRMRDVDWKRFAQFRRLMTRTWEKETEGTVAFLMDASRTMRASPATGTKLDQAATHVLELAEAATVRNHRVGFIAFDDLEVVEEIAPTRAANLPSGLAVALSSLPARILAARRLDVGLTGDAPFDEAEVEFLASLPREKPSLRRPRVGIDAAVARLVASAQGGTLFVVAFTDLESVPDRTLIALAGLAARGHRVLCVVLPGTRFLAAPVRVRLHDLENAYREIHTRERAALRLRAAGVQLIEMGPGENAARIAKASERGPTSVRGMRA